MEAFSAAVEGTTPREVMMLVLVTQYLDTMKEIGTQDQAQETSTRSAYPNAPKK